ncbi:MAG: hypothetical protein ACREHG_06025, partial [Candidatus Saccharimonadales bacterium]
HIERSHIGEFPWAFGECLKSLAEKLLTEPGLERARQLKDVAHPLLFIMAEGGLSAFEARNDKTFTFPSISKRRVFTIVVPRSLKNYVLLHAILGHEVCHAALWTEKLRPHINSATKPISRIDPLKSVKKLNAWAEHYCPDIQSIPERQAEDMRLDWLNELKCDLFGLIFMGPAYLAAMRTMLSLSDPTGAKLDTGHPPHVWRYQLLEYAYRELGWDKPLPTSVSKPIRDAQVKFNKVLFNYDHEAMGTDEVILKKEVEIATRKFRKLLKDHGAFDYRPPDPAMLETLIGDIRRRRPPIGQSVSDDKIDFAGAEFRQVLHAGWMSRHAGVSKDWPEEEKENEYTIINRLCEQAIIQGRGIALALGPDTTKRSPAKRKTRAR